MYPNFEDMVDPKLAQSLDPVPLLSEAPAVQQAVAVPPSPNISTKSNTGRKTISSKRVHRRSKPSTFKTKRCKGLSPKLLSKINVGKDVVEGKGEAAKQVNTHYREFVRSHRSAYSATGKDNAKKHKIAQLVIKGIAGKGGRFLDLEGDPMDERKAFKKVMKSLKDACRTSKKTSSRVKKDVPATPTSHPPHFWIDHVVSEDLGEGSSGDEASSDTGVVKDINQHDCILPGSDACNQGPDTAEDFGFVDTETIIEDFDALDVNKANLVSVPDVDMSLDDSNDEAKLLEVKGAFPECFAYFGHENIVEWSPEDDRDMLEWLARGGLLSASSFD